MLLKIHNITDGGKSETFCMGLKSEVRLGVMDSAGTTCDEAMKLVLRIDSAIYAAGINYVHAVVVEAVLQHFLM